MAELRSTGDPYQGSYGGYTGSSGGSGSAAAIGCLVVVVVVVSVLFGIRMLYRYVTSAPAQTVSAELPASEPISDSQLSQEPEPDSLPTPPVSVDETDQTHQEAKVVEVIPESTAALFTQSVGDLEQYRSQFMAWALQLTNAESRADAAIVLTAAIPFTQSVIDWNNYIDELRFLNLATVSPTEAADLVAQGRLLVANGGGLEGEEFVQQRIAFLSAIASRVTSDGKLVQSGLLEKLARVEYSAAWELHTREGNRYFVTERPTIDDEMYEIRFVAGPGKLESMRIAKTEIELAETGKTPLSDLATGLARLLARVDTGEWESVFFRAVCGVMDSQELDAIIKADLLKDLIHLGSTGSLPFEQAFASHREHLSKLPSTESLNPFDPELKLL